jgi:coatomer protein complex subunit gamma
LSNCRLTEEDTEYAIHAVKHVFGEHLVLQFDCTNTIAEQRLENVSVMLDLADAVSVSVFLHKVTLCI